MVFRALKYRRIDKLYFFFFFFRIYFAIFFYSIVKLDQISRRMININFHSVYTQNLNLSSLESKIKFHALSRVDQNLVGHGFFRINDKCDSQEEKLKS